MPGVVDAHTVDFRHGGGPMHVPVTHQVEQRVDALACEGLGEHLVNRQVAHNFPLFREHALDLRNRSGQRLVAQVVTLQGGDR
jgi:hypothetical protein